eukprot:3897845-Rhodomonas_salina.1
MGAKSAGGHQSASTTGSGAGARNVGEHLFVCTTKIVVIAGSAGVQRSCFANTRGNGISAGGAEQHFCEHHVRKNLCKECGGASICELPENVQGVWGAEICEHKMVRDRCKLCEGGGGGVQGVTADVAAAVGGGVA